MIADRFGHQPGQNDSSRQNSTAIFDGFSFRGYLIVSKTYINL